MGFFQDVAKATTDYVAAPVVAAQDVLVRGKSPKEAISRRVDELGQDVAAIGRSSGISGILGGGGGGGTGGIAGGGFGGPIAGTLYVPDIGAAGLGGGLTGRGSTDPTGLYQAAASDYYGGFGLDPFGNLSAAYTYDPDLIEEDRLRRAEAYDFDPQREQALGQLAAQSRSGLETALTGQAAAGGLTAADRMAMASSFNRQRMGAEADVLGQLGIAEGRNIWETQEANRQMLNQAYIDNLREGNLAQAENIRRQIEQTEKRGAIAQEMFEADKRIRAGERLAGGGGGYDPYASGTKGGGKLIEPKASNRYEPPKAKPKATTPSRGGGGGGGKFRRSQARHEL